MTSIVADAQSVNWGRDSRFDTPASRLLPEDKQQARRARMAARAQDAKRAMQLYAMDNAAAHERKGSYPKIGDYVESTWEDGPREQKATASAIARFDELPPEKPKRQRRQSAEARARHIARDRQRRREVA